MPRNRPLANVQYQRLVYALIFVLLSLISIAYIFMSKQTAPDARVDKDTYRSGTSDVTDPSLSSVLQKRKASSDITPSAFFEGSNVAAFEGQVDKNGIPIISGRTKRDSEYNPSYICRYGLYLNSLFHYKPTDETKQKIAAVTEWIEQNKVEDKRYITWYVDAEAAELGMIPPWTSALTNAWCAGMLLQSGTILNDQDLVSDSVLALEYLFTPVEQGGGLSDQKGGSIWFEEAPKVDDPSHILNGNIYAIEILDMFRDAFDNKKYDAYYENAIESLERNMLSYDKGYGTIYDQRTKGNKLGSEYQKIHYQQLYWAYLRTGNVSFLKTSQEWFEQDNQSDGFSAAVKQTYNPILHGKSSLTDFKYWHGYWSGTSEQDIILDLDTKSEIKRINIFSVNKLTDIDVSYKKADDPYIVIPKNGGSFKNSGYNNFEGTKTHVYSFIPDHSFKANKVKLGLKSADGKGVIALREIGIQRALEKQFRSEVDGYAHMQYVDSLRDKQSKTQ